jgi:hypothetical protein
LCGPATPFTEDALVRVNLFGVHMLSFAIYDLSL